MTRLCRKCRAEIPNWIVVEGVRHNVCQRKFCLTCSPFKQRNTRPELIDSPTGKLCRCGETRISIVLNVSVFVFSVFESLQAVKNNSKIEMGSRVFFM